MAVIELSWLSLRQGQGKAKAREGKKARKKEREKERKKERKKESLIL